MVNLLGDLQAEQISESSPHEKHTCAAKAALRDAAQALRTTLPGRPELIERVDAAHRAIAKIDEHTPFLEQRAVIDRAFVAVADAMLIYTPAPVSTASAPRTIR